MFRRSNRYPLTTPAGEPAGSPRRWGLYGPYIALAIAVTLWSGAWLMAREKVIQGTDRLAAKYESAGYEIAWKQRSVGGYPFRIDLVLTDVEVRDPEGWGMTSGRLEAEAFLHAPGHWVFAAPRGVSLLRPAGGPVEITGSTLHASLTGLDMRPPRFSFEGLNLHFRTLDGRDTFPMTGAEKIEAYLRPGPDHQAAVLFRLTKGRADRPGGIAEPLRLDLELEAILSRTDSLKGTGWTQTVKAWAAAGGQASLRSAKATAGPAMLVARPGTLGLDAAGRVSGQLDVSLGRPSEMLHALSKHGLIPKVSDADLHDLPADTVIRFRDGSAFLGTLAIGSAPGLF